MVITGTMPHRISVLTAQPGYGFDGISVALMANTSPFGVIASALLFAGLQYGGSSIQAELGAQRGGAQAESLISPMLPCG